MNAKDFWTASFEPSRKILTKVYVPKDTPGDGEPILTLTTACEFAEAYARKNDCTPDCEFPAGHQQEHPCGTKLPPTPASCSEVVERLPHPNDVRVECKKLLEKALALIKIKQGSEAEFERLLAHAMATFAAKQNSYHLGELSKRDKGLETLRGEINRLRKELAAIHSWAELGIPGPFYDEPRNKIIANIQKIAEQALAKSDEWREQIRKGATHD